LLKVLIGILFGLGPAAGATNIELSAELKGSAPSSRGTSLGGRLWSRKLLVTPQLAVSFLLVVAAGLFVETLKNLRSVDLGFDAHKVLVFELSPGANGYTVEKLVHLYDDVLDRLRVIPGVVSASASSDLLISDVAATGCNDIEIEGVSPSEQRMSACTNYVAPHFFETMRIPLLAGRGPQIGDTARAPKVAVVDTTFAHRYFPDRSPIGRHFRWRGEKDWIEVVGVVRDVRFRSVRAEPPPVTYLPYVQNPWLSDMSFEVRASTADAPVVKGIYSAVRALDPDLPVINMRTQQEQIDSSLNTERLFAQAAGLFGALWRVWACTE
jgi:hypothetical protein